MSLIIKKLDQVAYEPTWHSMQKFTAQRDTATQDEVWLCEHSPVFTQGRHGRSEHILNPQDIDVVHTDRGGQVTYHGPGQLMAYFLWDLKRLKIGPKALVCVMEQTLIDTLAEFGIIAMRKAGAPGIYVKGDKIASLGLRIKKGLSYHGLALNVDMDVTPFSYINPCGYEALGITQISEVVPGVKMLAVEQAFVAKLRVHRAALESA